MEQHRAITPKLSGMRMTSIADILALQTTSVTCRNLTALPSLLRNYQKQRRAFDVAGCRSPGLSTWVFRGGGDDQKVRRTVR